MPSLDRQSTTAADPGRCGRQATMRVTAGRISPAVLAPPFPPRPVRAHRVRPSMSAAVGAVARAGFWISRGRDECHRGADGYMALLVSLDFQLRRQVRPQGVPETAKIPPNLSRNDLLIDRVVFVQGRVGTFSLAVCR